MATINPKILKAAHDDDLITCRLTPRQKLYLHGSVQTANKIYQAIASQPAGTGVETLLLRTKIVRNTLHQYLRLLERIGVIESDRSPGQKAIYTKKA